MSPWKQCVRRRSPRADASDVCRISLSRDGTLWQPIFEKKETGEETVTIDLGRAARGEGRPHVYTAYTFLVKVELSSKRDAKGVGIRGLRVAAKRQLNKRTLPNLMPGENVLRISADRIAAGRSLEVEIRYRVDGKPMIVTRRTSRFPHYFRIDVPGVAFRVLKNYDQDFNDGALQMESIRLTLVPSSAGQDASLPEAEARAKFQESNPNSQLADLVNKKEVDAYESDVMQVSGFFPQSRAVWTDREKYAKLVETFKTGKAVERWVAAEDLGNYPEAIDLLCDALPTADIDLTLFIVKALAQIHDKNAIAPLLEKWKRGTGGTAGDPLHPGRPGGDRRRERRDRPGQATEGVSVRLPVPHRVRAGDPGRTGRGGDASGPRQERSVPRRARAGGGSAKEASKRPIAEARSP